jgi:hypothetical protein
MGSTVRVVTTVAVARGTSLKHTAPTIKTSVSVTTVRVLKGMITVTKTVRRRVTTVAVNRRTRVNKIVLVVQLDRTVTVLGRPLIVRVRGIKSVTLVTRLRTTTVTVHNLAAGIV